MGTAAGEDTVATAGAAITAAPDADIAAAARCTSSTVMRPRAPLPTTLRRSTPNWRAVRRAAGPAGISASSSAAPRGGTIGSCLPSAAAAGHDAAWAPAAPAVPAIPAAPAAPAAPPDPADPADDKAGTADTPTPGGAAASAGLAGAAGVPGTAGATGTAGDSAACSVSTNKSTCPTFTVSPLRTNIFSIRPA